MVRLRWSLVLLVIGCGSSSGGGDGGVAVDAAHDQDAGAATDALLDAEPADLSATIEAGDERLDMSLPEGGEGLGFSLIVTPTAVDFGGIFANDCPQPSATVQARNTGTGLTPVLQTMVLGHFVLAQDGCTGRRLAPAERCELVVQPRPVTMGEILGNLIVAGTPAADTVSVVLEAQVFPYDSESITPNVFDFGSVAVGAMSTAATFEIHNIGGQPFTHLMASSSTGEFVITRDECTGQVVAANGRCSVDVVFRPLSRGAKTALLTVEATACAPATAIAQLAGTGGP